MLLRHCFRFQQPQNKSEKWTSTFVLLSVHFLLDEMYKIPLYFPLECQSIHVRVCMRARVWGVNHSGGFSFISIVCQRSGGGVQHYTLSSPTLLSVSAELISEEGHIFTQQNGNDTQSASELQHFFLETGFFF